LHASADADGLQLRAALSACLAEEEFELARQRQGHPASTRQAIHPNGSTLPRVGLIHVVYRFCDSHEHEKDEITASFSSCCFYAVLDFVLRHQ
jgi:hypothetical protein|tara:strand:- start:166 stop:444 length:279 start_codon:yes stop_codon:yes gene_type:complete